MRVVTNLVATYIRSGHSATHKQGKLPVGVVLNTIGDTSKAWELDPYHTAEVINSYDPERNSDYSKYPAFWVQKADVIAETDAPPGQPPPVDPPYQTVGAGEAFVILMTWLRELWR